MSEAQQSHILVRVWRFFWRAITGFRTAILNLVFLVLLIVVISAVIESAPKPVTGPGPLFIAPSGVLVDQLSYEPPLAALSHQQKAAETLLNNLTSLINTAATDPRVTGLIIKLDDLQGGGMSKIGELGQAINNFKAQNKPVIAYSNMFNQQQYLLASYANTIYMHDMGTVAINGFGLYRNYFKGLIDKLGINVHVFKSGTFKDFVEPYIREDMSEPSRLHNQAWLTELWAGYSEQIETRRQLPVGSLDTYIKTFAQLLTISQGDTARLAADYKLVDRIGSKQQLIDQLIAQFQADPENPAMFNYIDPLSYQQEIALKKMQQKGNIGLIVAAGTILDGEQPEGSIGGDTLSQLIRKARNNKDMQALVIRVDSGGGSAFASELIRQEIQETRKAGKPVFISMGSMAASGGYWLSTGADEIWATPTTLTGSIGVFSIIPTLEKTLNKIGITSDGIATSELAGLFQLDRPMTPAAEQVFQLGVDSIYQKFLRLCAEARQTSVESISQVAEGRVWLGSKALEHNLVDSLGSLDDVIAAIAEKNAIKKPVVQLIERDLSPMEEIVKNIMQNTHAQSLIGNTAAYFNNTPSANIINQLQQQFNQTPAAQIIADQLKQPAQTKTYAACTECTVH